MNAPLIWRDPVVAEIHAIRAELAKEYADDLVAYSNAAMAHCQEMNFQVGEVQAKSLASSQGNSASTFGESNQTQK